MIKKYVFSVLTDDESSIEIVEADKIETALDKLKKEL
jgi:hypothetical protein